MAHYRGTGTDLTSNGINLTNTGGVTLAPDRFGEPNKAGQYDGGNYFRVTTHSLLPTGSNARTISLWVRTSQVPTAEAGLLNYGTSQGAGGRRFGLLVSRSVDAGTDYFVGELADLRGSRVVTDDRWHNITVTYDGSRITLWVDCTWSGTATPSLNTTGTDLNIGRSAFDRSTPEPFIGFIDDVRIYDRVLSGPERGLLCLENGFRP